MIDVGGVLTMGGGSGQHCRCRWWMTVVLVAALSMHVVVDVVTGHRGSQHCCDGD